MFQISPTRYPLLAGIPLERICAGIVRPLTFGELRCFRLRVFVRGLWGRGGSYQPKGSLRSLVAENLLSKGEEQRQLSGADGRMGSEYGYVCVDR